MPSKVRVYGKAQNRTALGIMHAYMVMYPQATLEDLIKAFPAELAPDNGTKKIFIDADENSDMAWDGYFKREDEILVDGNGKKVAVNKMWTKPSFERLINHAKNYDIEIAQFDPAEKGFGKKGSFALEYLNGYVPPVRKNKKGLPWWLWLILGLIIAGVVVALCLPRDEKVVEKIVEKEVIVRDTVYVKQIADIEANFNAAQFEQGKAELNDDAKLALHDLAKVMKQNDEVKLRIEGHTSAEGDDATNQALSEARAKAAVDFLVNKEGINGSRLEAVGKGSSELKDKNNPTSDVNRRTEFQILKKSFIMADFKIDGRMKVKGLKEKFKDTFGLSLRVYTTVSCKAPAKDDATLASIRAEGAKGGEIVVGSNRKVGSFEKMVADAYGIGVQVANASNTKLANDNDTLAAAAKK